jgi:uncharacterized repeat protein (TIGR03803 family)
MAAATLQAQTFTTLASFDGTDGGGPNALVQGYDGNFYGTGGGGLSDHGIVYKITPGGTLTRLYSFCHLTQCADGSGPYGPLVLATNGKFYGTTLSGGSGSDGCGTVFDITPAGKLTTLHVFEGVDGCGLYAGLIQAANGNFYGTTYVGGTNGGGTIFEITAAGKFSTLYSFCSLPNCADGEGPVAGLVQATDGEFYGTAAGGGLSNGGTVFKITPAGKLTTLYSFCSLPNCADGSGPSAALIQATDGNLYGTTYTGGANCPPYGCGTVFEITTAGSLTTLYSFCSLPNCTDGIYSYTPLVQATDSNFYGVTWSGGTGSGTLFEVTSAGTLTTLYTFCSQPNCADGRFPGGLLQATNGSFYGPTGGGGAKGDGTVYSLNTGLGPFVSFVRNPAKVGAEFGILGQGLKGTTSVSLNGVPVKFTVKYDTLLLATVPSGATTGYVTVNTRSGVLTSNVPFQVIQ